MRHRVWISEKLVGAKEANRRRLLLPERMQPRISKSGKCEAQTGSRALKERLERRQGSRESCKRISQAHRGKVDSTEEANGERRMPVLLADFPKSSPAYEIKAS